MLLFVVYAYSLFWWFGCLYCYFAACFIVGLDFAGRCVDVAVRLLLSCLCLGGFAGEFGCLGNVVFVGLVNVC